jgi:hypothetical protein
MTLIVRVAGNPILIDTIDIKDNSGNKVIGGSSIPFMFADTFLRELSWIEDCACNVGFVNCLGDAFFFHECPGVAPWCAQERLADWERWFGHELCATFMYPNVPK